MEMSGLATIYGNGSTTEILPKEITSHTLRRGKWTVEEERYTEKIIMDFENGTLDVPEGTTLRTYLSKVLNCDPMRITKKYTGNSSIGKRTFTPLVRSPENVPFIDLSQRELEELRRNWISKLLLAEQWNHRKLSLMKNGKPFFAKSDDSSSVNSQSPSNHYHPHDENDVEGDAMNHEHNVKLREDTISNALKPFIADPTKISFILTWLKTSCAALHQPTTSIEEIEQLIQIGELSVPALEKVLKNAGITTASQIDTLHKMINQYTDRGDNNNERADRYNESDEDEDDRSSENQKVKLTEQVVQEGEETDSGKRNNGKIHYEPAGNSHASVANHPYSFYYNQLAAACGSAAISDRDKKSRRKRDRSDGPLTPTLSSNNNPSTTGYPDNFPMYFPNYLYGYSSPFPGDFMNTAAMRMPSYQEYVHALYLQQNGIMPTTPALIPHHPAESLYDPIYMRQMNHWMTSRPQPITSEDREAYQTMLQQSSGAPKKHGSCVPSLSENGRSNSGNTTITPPLQNNRSSDAAIVTPTVSLKSTSTASTNKKLVAEKLVDDAHSDSSTAKFIVSSSNAFDDNVAVGPVKKKQKSTDNLIKSVDVVPSPPKPGNAGKQSAAAGSGTKKPKAIKAARVATSTVDSVEAIEGSSIEFAAEALLGLQRR